MNTAPSTSAMAMTAVPTWSIVSWAASRGVMPERDVALDVLDHDDRVVDDDADGQHHAEQRQRVEGEAERRHDRAGADQRDGDGDDRDERRAPALQEDQDDEDDENDRLASVS